MADNSVFTPEQLDKMDKQALIALIISQQSQLSTISSQLNLLTQQVAIMNQRAFGRKTEQKDQVPNQLSFQDYFNDEVFNALIVRDIIRRYKIRNVALLNKLVDFLMDNIGNITSIRKIAATLTSNKIIPIPKHRLLRRIRRRKRS